MTIEVKESAAERGKRDLFFLASVILGKNYPDLDERVHKPVCDVFVQKDPNIPFKKLDKVKNRLILDPRGHLKTSLDIVDCIQWMLCYPDIRILLMSGTEKLVQRMVSEMKGIFMQNEDFRAIYPEYCPPAGATKWGDADGFTLPNRKLIRREPTISIATIDSQKAGSHYDVIKGDDIVNEINSANRAQCQKVTTLWNHITPLLDPGGYKDLIGTRYDWSDLYGETLAKGTPLTLKSFQRAAWVIKDNQKYVLWPQRFCLDRDISSEKQNLEQTEREDPFLFSCQYLNNPMPSGTQNFTPELLNQHTVARKAIPSSLRVYAAWDLAYSSKKESDYTVGAVGGFDQDGTLYVLDIIRGQWSPQQIITEMVRSARIWPIARQGIENAVGSNLIIPGLQSAQAQAGFYFPVDMIQITRQKDRTLQMVSSLEPLLRMNKLYFNSSMTHLQTMYEEFIKFPKFKHDDICVAIALLLHFRTAAFGKPVIFQEPEISTVRDYNPFADIPSNGDSEQLSGGLVG